MENILACDPIAKQVVPLNRIMLRENSRSARSECNGNLNSPERTFQQLRESYPCIMQLLFDRNWARKLYNFDEI